MGQEFLKAGNYAALFSKRGEGKVHFINVFHG